MCYWWHHWHHDTNTGTNGVTWPESHVASRIDCVDLKNTIVLFTVLSTSRYQCKWGHATKKAMFHMISVTLMEQMQWGHWQSYQYCDANASTSGVTCPKSHIAPHFDLLKSHKCNGAISDDTISIIWCWVLVPTASHEQNSHVAPHIDNLDLMNAMIPLMIELT